MEFIDLASLWGCFAVDVASRSFENILLYATMGKLHLFAPRMVKAAEKAMDVIVEAYYALKFDLKTRPTIDQNFDILRDFTERCRAELR